MPSGGDYTARGRATVIGGTEGGRLLRKHLGRHLFALLAVVALNFPTLMPSAGAAPGEVLILGPTVSGGASSTLAQKFVLAGKTPVVVDAATWGSMTAAQFDAFDAIVLGDPTCAGLGPEAAATANTSTWAPVVDGNVILIGTDETFHQSQGGDLLMEKAAAFTVAQSGKTGAYISLSCYYHGTAALTPVPLLNGFGTFTVTGVGCFNDAHIVATHPALAGLTDTTLSNWSCSVHEAFDSWPVSFEVLAIAEGIGTIFTAPDGSVGTPYILARGVEVISDIDLAPLTATNAVGTSHTLTATVTRPADEGGTTPVVGTTVTFTVIEGPHTGTTGTGVTNSLGVATFSYTGTAVGTDTAQATFVDGSERTQRSNRVAKTWEASTEPELCSHPNILGTPGDDVLRGTEGRDVISGGGGNDTIRGRAENDVICGGPGNDTLIGGNERDLLFGQEGNDNLSGGNHPDHLDGGPDTDTCNGGRERDTAVDCERTQRI